MNLKMRVVAKSLKSRLHCPSPDLRNLTSDFHQTLSILPPSTKLDPSIAHTRGDDEETLRRNVKDIRQVAG